MKDLFTKFLEGFSFTALYEKFIEQPVISWAALGGLVLLAVILFIVRGEKFTPRMLATGAICMAVAFILSFITLYRMPQGGSITPASMLPIIAFSYAFGAPAGIVVGIAYGLLQLTQGVYIVHPVQFLFDYILPFAFLGLAGLFKKKNLILAIVVACLLRFASHFVSGMVFWGEYAPAGQSVWLYSLIYNGSYMLPETVVCLVVAVIPAMNKVIKGLNSGIKA
jgi:thiamine transporter